MNFDQLKQLWPFGNNKGNLLKRITTLALPGKKLFFFAVAITILQAVLSAVQPYLYQHTIDEYIVKPDLHGLAIWCGIILGSLTLQALLNFTGGYMSELIGQNVIFHLRNYVYKHLVKLRLSFFDKTPVGTTVTRTISDIETVSELFASGLITIAGDLFQIAVLLVLMFTMNWRLALVSLSVLPLLIYAANKFRKGVRDSFQEVRNEVAKLNAFLQEHISGMGIVQLFNREEKELQKFKKINQRHRDANIRGIFYYAVFFPVVEVIVALTFALIVWYGTRGLMKDTVQFGQLTAFIMFINLFFRPIRAIADRFNNIQMGMVAADRIFTLLDEEENIEKDGKFKVQQLQGSIAFNEVWFAYQNEDWVLKNISFTAQPGETIALVGHTGSGKSSLIQLVNKFYTHQKGEIKIDGKNIDEYDLNSLRNKVAVVLQDVFLFSGSITENIRLKDAQITEEQIKKAAKSIGAYEFIDKLPGGFDYNVMERGLTLSLGQRQLISFIRALAFNPSIIILDEATSSIDTETEQLIQKAIAALMQNRTALVVAHRLSTIRNATQILVLESGEIIERGNHDTLIKKAGKYAHLYATQFGNTTEPV